MENIKNQYSTLVVLSISFFSLLLFSTTGCKTQRWQEECIHSHICCDMGCKCCSFPRSSAANDEEVFQPNKSLAWEFPMIIGNELNPDFFHRIKGRIKVIKEYKSINDTNAYNLENIIKYDRRKVVYFKHYISNNSIEDESSYKEYLFTYDSIGNLKEEKILYVDKGETIFEKNTKDLNQSILKMLDLKKLKKNEKGEVTSYLFLNDTVSCTYNKRGQKDTEIIEVVKDIKYRYHWYTYTKTSVNIKTNYQFASYNTEYKFDKYGNWIKRKTVYENTGGVDTFSKRIIEYN
jgi:hypothetical protein